MERISVNWERVKNVIQHDEKLGAIINVIGTLLPPQLEDVSIDSYYLAEIKTGVALAYRLSAGPPLRERCKELSASL